MSILSVSGSPRLFFIGAVILTCSAGFAQSAEAFDIRKLGEISGVTWSGGDEANEVDPPQNRRIIGIAALTLKDQGRQRTSSVSLTRFWGALGQTPEFRTLSPAQAVYDEMFDRWVIAQIASQAESKPVILLAISHSSQPEAAWDAYALTPGAGAAGTGQPAIVFRGAQTIVALGVAGASPSFSESDPLIVLPAAWVSMTLDRESLYKGSPEESLYKDAPWESFYKGSPKESLYKGAPEESFYKGAPKKSLYEGSPRQDASPAAITGATPGVYNLNPATGTGRSQAFSFDAGDADGADDIRIVQLLISSSLDGHNACFVVYDRLADQFRLITDAGTGFAGSLNPGQQGFVENSQCVLKTGTRSVTGPQIALDINLSFKSGFSGSKSVYLFASDAENMASGWYRLGNWTVPAVNAAPQLITAPNLNAMSRGSIAEFAVTYEDSDGGSTIQNIQFLITSSPHGRNACYLLYDGTTNQISLINDSGTGPAGSLTPGTSTTLQNSQCTLNGAWSTVSTTSLQRTLTVAVTFSSTFAGQKYILSLASDDQGTFAPGNSFSGSSPGGSFSQFGTFTVTSAPVPPGVSGPSQATVSSGPYRFDFIDANIGGGVRQANMLFTSAYYYPDGRNACFVIYDRASNQLRLVNDSGAGYLGSVTPGVPGSIANTQCQLNGATSSVTTTFTTLRIFLSLDFRPGFPHYYFNYIFGLSINSNGIYSQGSYSPGYVSVGTLYPE